MDKWIIQSIEYQNDAMNRTVKSLKDSVMKGKYNDYIKHIELDDFSEQYQIIEYNDILQGKIKKKMKMKKKLKIKFQKMHFLFIF